MKTIWKFKLLPYETILDMPSDAQVLAVGNHGDSVMLWALVDPGNKLEKRTFATHYTGAGIQGDHERYIGTSQFGGIVRHVFEKTAK